MASGLLLALGAAAALAQTPGPFPPESERQRILADWQRMGYKVPKNEVIVQLSPTANSKLKDYIAQNAEATTVVIKAGEIWQRWSSRNAAMPHQRSTGSI